MFNNTDSFFKSSKILLLLSSHIEFIICIKNSYCLIDQTLLKKAFIKILKLSKYSDSVVT